MPRSTNNESAATLKARKLAAERRKYAEDNAYRLERNAQRILKRLRDNPNTKIRKSTLEKYKGTGNFANVNVGVPPPVSNIELPYNRIVDNHAYVPLNPQGQIMTIGEAPAERITVEDEGFTHDHPLSYAAIQLWNKWLQRDVVHESGKRDNTLSTRISQTRNIFKTLAGVNARGEKADEVLSKINDVTTLLKDKETAVAKISQYYAGASSKATILNELMRLYRDYQPIRATVVQNVGDMRTIHRAATQSRKESSNKAVERSLLPCVSLDAIMKAYLAYYKDVNCQEHMFGLLFSDCPSRDDFGRLNIVRQWKDIVVKTRGKNYMYVPERITTGKYGKAILVLQDHKSGRGLYEFLPKAVSQETTQKLINFLDKHKGRKFLIEKDEYTHTPYSNRDGLRNWIINRFSAVKGLETVGVSVLRRSAYNTVRKRLSNPDDTISEANREKLADLFGHSLDNEKDYKRSVLTNDLSVLKQAGVGRSKAGGRVRGSRDESSDDEEDEVFSDGEL